MVKLESVMRRVQIESVDRAAVAEMVRLGFRGSVTDEDRAQHIIETGEVGPSEQASIVAEYQAFWQPDLDYISDRLFGKEHAVTGDIDRPTLKSVEDRVCGAPDVMRASDGTPMEARWLDSCKDNLKWHVDYSAFSESTFGLSQSEVEAEFVQCFNEMMSLFDVTLTRVQSRSEAHYQESFARLGGNILGVHYLANNTCSPKTGQFNIMRWPSLDYLGQVLRHETTHGLGLGHVPGRTLMNPSIVWPLEGRVGNTGWTQRDIDAVMGLGYKKPTAPPPQPEPDQRVAGHVVTRDGRRVPVADMTSMMLHVRRGGAGPWEFNGGAELSDGSVIKSADIAEIVSRVRLN